MPNPRITTDPVRVERDTPSADGSGDDRRSSPQAQLPVRVDPMRTHDAYQLFPTHPLPPGAVEAGYVPIAEAVDAALATGRPVAIDGVAGVFWGDVIAGLREGMTDPDSVHWIDVRTAMLGPREIDAMLAPSLPDDPIFGHRYPGELEDFFEVDAWARLAEGLPTTRPTVLFGPGAALLALDADAFIAYADVARNELQYRFRARSVANLGSHRPLAAKEAYRRAYFVDWVVAQRHFAKLLPRLDRFIDAQRLGPPTSLSGQALRSGLATLNNRPFRVRPWFEPGAWGGEWIKRHVEGLAEDVPNYAWSFELIVPENGILFASDGVLAEVPFHALHAQERENVLGSHADRFAELFPIRFDWLDTVDGGNLSLQCHPSPEYAREQFGEPFTQDETYYILHAEPEAEVYLGFHDDIDPAAFRDALEASARSGTEVDVRSFVQTHPARRGDLFLIPHGTVHCSGRGSLVLEISATPYIFTFKMYDWLRLDLDGNPRPLNIERAFENLDFSYRGAMVEEALHAQPVVIAVSDEGRLVHLPTHRSHFYDVHRIELTGAMTIRTEGSPHVLAVVAGDGVGVRIGESRWHYAFAETFVVPASVDTYTLENTAGRPVEVVKAFLK